eukprot:11104870-Alexandrium_andersonii.AAC.1
MIAPRPLHRWFPRSHVPPCPALHRVILAPVAFFLGAIPTAPLGDASGLALLCARAEAPRWPPMEAQCALSVLAAVEAAAFAGGMDPRQAR